MQAAQQPRFLDGTQPLWKAFWLLFVLGSLCFIGAIATLFSIDELMFHLARMAYELGMDPEDLLAVCVGVLISCYLPFFAFCFLAVWRCAKNTSRRWLGILAKLVVCAELLRITAQLFVAAPSVIAFLASA